MNLFQAYYDTLATSFSQLLRRRLDNAPRLAQYVATHLRKTAKCRSVYALKQKLPFHVFSGEMASALRRAGYKVNGDQCNATEAE